MTKFETWETIPQDVLALQFTGCNWRDFDEFAGWDLSNTSHWIDPDPEFLRFLDIELPSGDIEPIKVKQWLVYYQTSGDVFIVDDRQFQRMYSPH